MADRMTYQCPACAGEMTQVTHRELEEEHGTTLLSSPMVHFTRCRSCGSAWQFVTRWRTPPHGTTTLEEEIADFTRRRLEHLVGEL